MTIEEMLENKDTVRLEWGEPWRALTADGKIKDSHVTMQVTVADCINISRAVTLDGMPDLKPTEKDLLLDFMAVHWAEVIT